MFTLKSESNSSCVAVFESTRVVVRCIRVYVLLCIAFECMYSVCLQSESKSSCAPVYTLKCNTQYTLKSVIHLIWWDYCNTVQHVCLQSESNSSCVPVFESTRVLVHCIRVHVLLCIAFECMYSVCLQSESKSSRVPASPFESTRVFVYYIWVYVLHYIWVYVLHCIVFECTYCIIFECTYCIVWYLSVGIALYLSVRIAF